MNKATLLLLSAFIAIIPAAARNVFANSSRGYSFGGVEIPDGRISARCDTSEIRAVDINAGTDDFRLSLVADDLNPYPDRKYTVADADGKKLNIFMQGWEIRIRGHEPHAPVATVAFSQKKLTDPFGAEKYMLGCRLRTSPFAEKQTEIPGGLRPPSRYRILLSRSGGKLHLLAGTGELEDIGALDVPDEFSADKIEIAVAPAADIALKALSFVHTPTSAGRPAASFAEIDSAIADADDPRAGYWALTGFTLDDNVTRKGGDYDLAIAPDGAGGFLIYYMRGAAVCPDRWKSGALKAILIPTADDNFRAVWYAAAGEIIDDAIAFFSSPDDLIVSFPSLAGASVALRRNSDFRP